MSVVVLRGDARRLPLPDASVDLIVTSPPYFGLRSYTDGGGHYDGQIGSEATPQEWVAALVACTAEWVRVLKPSGSIFVNLGDKYAQRPGQFGSGNTGIVMGGGGARHEVHVAARRTRAQDDYGVPPKSLLGLPWRYALACMDELGLILRRDIIWSKPNGLPESVTDRCRSSHEYLFHFTRMPRYYAAVDEIREPHVDPRIGSNGRARDFHTEQLSRKWNPSENAYNPLGKLPGSVWEIPSQPLSVPAHLGVDHFAAFPMELPRRVILGWSPPGVCTACGEGRRPVVATAQLSEAGEHLVRTRNSRDTYSAMRGGDSGIRHHQNLSGTERARLMDPATITGYACGCTPYTDHPGAGGIRPAEQARSTALGNGVRDNPGGGYGNAERTGPWREYHLDGWTPPPVRPAVVVDPFGGTGTTALVASMLGRLGFSFDLSADYCRLARWRTTDPAERAKALQVPKPPPVPSGQGSLFDDLEAS